MMMMMMMTQTDGCVVRRTEDDDRSVWCRLQQLDCGSHVSTGALLRAVMRARAQTGQGPSEGDAITRLRHGPRVISVPP